ncbi:MAG: hypothetical protein WCJ30_08145 [Deltaproteobacteria bacterium]
MHNVRPLVQIVHVSDVGLLALPSGRREPDALEQAAFARFVLALTASDPVWRKHTAWFVASHVAARPNPAAFGHLTTDADLDLLDRIAPRTAFRARLVLPGPDETRDPSRAPVAWPAPPLVERSIDGRTEVQLYALDTRDGAVDALPLVRLAALAAMHRGDSQTTPVRVVVTHHPIPALLREAARRVPGPLAHLHLAAHTAGFEPARADASAAFIAPGAWSHAGLPWSGSASIVRLYAALGQPGVVVCERLVATRAAATGRWAVCPDEQGETSHEWLLRG